MSKGDPEIAQNDNKQKQTSSNKSKQDETRASKFKHVFKEYSQQTVAVVMELKAVWRPALRPQNWLM